MGSCPALKMTKKDGCTLNSQPQVIKFNSLTVGGSLQLQLVAIIAEILLKVALKHQKSNQINVGLV